MKKSSAYISGLLGIGILTFVTVVLPVYLYKNYEVFRLFFEGNRNTATSFSIGATHMPATLQLTKAPFFVFVGIMILQLLVLLTSFLLLMRIRNSNDTAAIKMRKIENADIFLDLPLYIGLFGTITSFVILAVAPNGSRLIAYSSTLIGILFSVILRIFVLYPIKKWLIEKQEKTS